jgi:hypothetical protein
MKQSTWLALTADVGNPPRRPDLRGTIQAKERGPIASPDAA